MSSLALSLVLALSTAAPVPDPPAVPAEAPAAAGPSGSVVARVRAVAAAWTDADRADRKAEEAALAEPVRTGLAGVPSGPDKVAVFIAMSRLQLHQGTTFVLSGRDRTTELRNLIKLHIQLRANDPTGPHLFELAGRAWMAAMLLDDLDAAGAAADAALADAGSDLGRAAFARLLRAEVHAARGETDAAVALLAEAATQGGPVPHLTRARLVELGGAAPEGAVPDPQGSAPPWLLGIEGHAAR